MAVGLWAWSYFQLSQGIQIVNDSDWWSIDWSINDRQYVNIAHASTYVMPIL